MPTRRTAGRCTCSGWTAASSGPRRRGPCSMSPSGRDWLDSLASREWRPRPAAGQSARSGRHLDGGPLRRTERVRRYALRALRAPRARRGPGERQGPQGGPSGRVHRLPRLAGARPGAHEQRGAAPARDGARAGPPVAGARHRHSCARSGRASAGSGIPAATATTRSRSTRRRRSRSRSTSSRSPRRRLRASPPTQLEQYELLVPGTSAMVRYFALQPIYARHPLRRMLTTGSIE